jgi:hypothetical protein
MCGPRRSAYAILTDQFEVHAPTIGILLCAGRNDKVVPHSLAGTTAPLAVADYTYDTLPPLVRELVPTENELASAQDDTTTDHTQPRLVKVSPSYVAAQHIRPLRRCDCRR